MTPLETILIDRIRESGPLPFAAFMSLALYHPQHGYYTSGTQRTGWRGHFLTSPELDPAFGALWARGFERLWHRCGEPAEFSIIEVGPGEGTFAAAVLQAAQPPFGDALTYTLVERSGILRARQERLLSGAPGVRWVESITDVERRRCACVFANEVLDNLPVHLVRRRGDRLFEVCVAVQEEGLTFVELEPSSPELGRFLERCGVEVPDGHRFEVSLAAESFVARISSMFEIGAAVFVDYGDSAAGLARRPHGTLLAYSERGTDNDVLGSPGTKDITAHVNWTAVHNACRRAGLAPRSLMTQRDALIKLGLHELHDELRTQHDEAVASRRGVDAVAALSRRQALGALADPGGLGALDVLVATKQLDGFDLLS